MNDRCSREIESLLRLLGKLTRALDKYKSNKLSRDDIKTLYCEIENLIKENKDCFDEFFLLSSSIPSASFVDFNKDDLIKHESQVLKRYNVSNRGRNEVIRKIKQLDKKEISMALSQITLLADTPEKFLMVLREYLLWVLDGIDKNRSSNKSVHRRIREFVKNELTISAILFICATLIIFENATKQPTLSDISKISGSIIYKESFENIKTWIKKHLNKEDLFNCTNKPYS